MQTQEMLAKAKGAAQKAVPAATGVARISQKEKAPSADNLQRKEEANKLLQKLAPKS